jgi:hypothetical protein
MVHEGARSGAAFRSLRARTYVGFGSAESFGELPACKPILDVIGDLFADVCQLEEFLLDNGIFGLLGKLSIHGRLLPQIVVPLHTYLPRKGLSSLALLVIGHTSLWQCWPSAARARVEPLLQIANGEGVSARGSWRVASLRPRRLAVLRFRGFPAYCATPSHVDLKPPPSRRKPRRSPRIERSRRPSSADFIQYCWAAARFLQGLRLPGFVSLASANAAKSEALPCERLGLRGLDHGPQKRPQCQDFVKTLGSNSIQESQPSSPVSVGISPFG